MDKIAIVGWGSLFRNPGGLEVRRPMIGGPWKRGGPMLQLEFSRVSGLDSDGPGAGRLTLVIDEVHGVQCETLVARSSNRDLNEAIRNLREREGTTNPNIGRINYRDRDTFPRWCHDPSDGDCSNALAAMKEWVSRNRYDAIIWTGLRSNFQSAVGEPFGIESAIAHLRRLPRANLRVALAYFKNAPKQIRTPLRTRVEREFRL